MLGLEALSRGAERATFLEQHYPTADIIRQNIAALGVAEQADVVTGNVFIGWPRPTAAVPADKPWLVFCSPPYDFYVRRTEEMLNLIVGLIRAAPVDEPFRCRGGRAIRFPNIAQSGRVGRASLSTGHGGYLSKGVTAVYIHNLSRVAAFITKDGSEIRELLGRSNSCVRNQSLAEARLPAGGRQRRTTTSRPKRSTTFSPAKPSCRSVTRRPPWGPATRSPFRPARVTRLPTRAKTCSDSFAAVPPDTTTLFIS